MKTPVAFLFSGQGAQHVGMGADLIHLPEVRQIFDDAGRCLGFDLASICLNGPESLLTETRYCQPALYVHGLACAAALQARVPVAATHAAGLSLGEFTAHACAGTFSFADGLSLVATRGAAMQEACDATAGGMLSLVGATTEQAREIAAECDLDVANLNCPGQIVLSGEASRIEGAVAAAKARGIKRAIPLKVAGAYHSRLMQPARDKLAAALAGAALAEPRIPVVANFTAAPAAGPAAIRDTLLQQVTGSVRWEESILHLRGLGVRHFIEFGPGGVLAGLLKRIDPDLRGASVGNAETLEKAVAFALEENLAAA